MGGIGLGRAFENQSGLRVGRPLQHVERPEQGRVGCSAAPVQGSAGSAPLSPLRVGHE